MTEEHSRQVPFRYSLRTKLVLVSILIEIVMLATLLGNSLRLLNEAVEDQTQTRLEDLSPLLNAALASRLFERDHETITEIIQQLLNNPSAGFRYIIVYDDRGTQYADAGQVDTRQLPAIDEDVASSLVDGVYDQKTTLMLSNQPVGQVRFGLSVASFLNSRDTIIRQGLIIATTEVLLTLILLGIAGYLLTQHINSLVNATRRITEGDYSTTVRITARDEIGLLGDHFNQMRETIGKRVRDLNASEKALFAAKERAEVTLLSIGDAVITTDMDSRIENLNPVAQKLTGWTTEEAVGRPLEEVFRISDEFSEEPVENPISRCLHQRRVIKLQNHTVLTDRSGNSYPIEDSAAPIFDRNGKIIGAVLVFHDVSKARHMTRQLKYQASHDALTGLYNRDEFERRMRSALDDAKVDGSEHVLCYLDLDQFKLVNDTCGHIAGDELLRQLGNLLKAKVRDSDILARLGGDEFGLLIMNCPFERARNIVETIRDEIREFQFVWANQSFQIGVSIGVVPVRADSGTLSDMLSAADVICYLAKEQGRNCVRYYEKDDDEHAQRYGEMQWSSRIISALRENRFVLHYQKIVSLDNTNEPLIEAELLVRMLDNDGNIIMPGAFIPAAERYQHMTDIDRWVIRAAFRSPDIMEKSPRIRGFTINISGQSLCADDFLSFVITEIESSGIEPGRVCFEITETTAIANLSRAKEIISELRGKGCLFALDDFGSGLSSFAYLKNLTVDFLKIDGTFIRDIVEDRTDHAMVEAINQVGHAMNIQTIAEFIESAEIKSELFLMGIDYGQGYAIHKPEPLRMA